MKLNACSLVVFGGSYKEGNLAGVGGYYDRANKD